MSDELTELPEGWEWTTLGELVLSIQYGYTASATDEPIGPKFLRITDLQDNSVNWESVPFCNCDEVGKYKLAKGDIVIARTGATTGKSFLLKDLPETTVFASYLIRLHTSSQYPPEYLAWFMQSTGYWQQITTVSKGTAQPGANAFILSNLTVPIPPCNEQKRIVAKIEELRDRHQRAKQALETIPELCDRFRQSVLAAAFRGDLTADWREQNPDIEPASVLLERIRGDRRDRWERLELEKMEAQGKVPKDDQWKGKYKETTGRGSRQLVAEIKAQKYRLEDLPDTWTAIKLGEVLQVQTGYAFKSQWFVPDGVRLLRGTNIVPGSTRWEDVVYLSEQQAAEFEEFHLFEEDIVIAMDRPVISTGLKIARLNSNDLPALLLQRVGRFKLESGIDPDYLFGFLNSQLFLGHVQDQATGTQLPHISANDIESAIMPLPPVKEQEQISKMISAWMLRVSEFTKLVESASIDYARIQQSILAKAFRGELVEQDPNDEPASVLLDRIRAEREKSSKSTKGRGRDSKASKGAAEQMTLPDTE